VGTAALGCPGELRSPALQFSNPDSASSGCFHFLDYLIPQITRSSSPHSSPEGETALGPGRQPWEGPKSIVIPSGL